MVNDYFIGAEMGTLNADKFALEFIEADILKQDKILMDKKFWDYKMWHPTVATMYFVNRYHAIAATVIEREVGKTEAAAYRRRALKYDLRNQKLAVIRGFWKARMMADIIGCTYDTYIRACIRLFRANYKMFATTKGPRKQHLPYAVQMSMPMFTEEAIKEWTAEKVKRFPLPEHAGIPNNNELWFRPEMEAWLIEEAGKHEFGSHYLKKAREQGIVLAPA